MKYIENATSVDLKNYTVSEELYNKLGQVSENQKEKTFAKLVQFSDNANKPQNSYFITIHNNIPYDPYGIYSHREQSLSTFLKKVSKQTFDYYLLYLKTRNLLYMTRTQRSFLNG